MDKLIFCTPEIHEKNEKCKKLFSSVYLPLFDLLLAAVFYVKKHEGGTQTASKTVGRNQKITCAFVHGCLSRVQANGMTEIPAIAIS